VQLINELALAGRQDVAPARLMEEFNRRFRLLGWQGLVGRRYRPRHGVLDALRACAQRAAGTLGSAASRARYPLMTAYGLVDVTAICDDRAFG